jgi:hypothetical protein
VTVFAKSQHDTGLTFLDNKEPADQPEKENDRTGYASADARVARIIAIVRRSAAGATTAFATKKTVDSLVELSPELIEVRRTIIRPTGLTWLFPIFILRTTPPTRIIEGEDKAEFFSY